MDFSRITLVIMHFMQVMARSLSKCSHPSSIGTRHDQYSLVSYHTVCCQDLLISSLEKDMRPSDTQRQPTTPLSLAQVTISTRFLSIITMQDPHLLILCLNLRQARLALRPFQSHCSTNQVLASYVLPIMIYFLTNTSNLSTYFYPKQLSKDI